MLEDETNYDCIEVLSHSCRVSQTAFGLASSGGGNVASGWDLEANKMV